MFIQIAFSVPSLRQINCDSKLWKKKKKKEEQKELRRLVTSCGVVSASVSLD